MAVLGASLRRACSIPRIVSRRPRRDRGSAIVLLALIALALEAGPAAARQRSDSVQSMKMQSMAGGWRMPPMRMYMPMIPGLEGEVPAVTPFLPRTRVPDPSVLPLATPRRIIEVGEGDTVELRAMLVRRRIRNRTFVMYGYNAQYPGPLLRVRENATIHVRFINGIDAPSTIHWHGIRLDNRYDGVPGVTQEPVEPGDTFLYTIHFPDAGIYWYHPHVREDIQQDLGLAGNLLVDPLSPDHYSPVNREETLILDDLLIDEQGLVPWGLESPTHALMGRFGNTLLVNGEPDYRMTVRRGEVVRFYITNVANTRMFNLGFGNARVKVVAADVSLFSREAWVRSVPLAPAERYIVEVSFDQPGTIALTSRVKAIDHYRGEYVARTDTLGTIRVLDEPAEPDLSAPFGRLRENRDVEAGIDRYRAYFERPPDHRVTLTVDVGELPVPVLQMLAVDTFFRPPVEWNETMPMMNWLSSGRNVRWVLRDDDSGREDRDIHWVFRQGDVVKIRFFNDARSLHPMQHPIHLHGQRFIVLDVNGIRNSNMAWKDTAVIPNGATVDLLVEMSNPGDWMLHCHIAEHLSAGMMMVFTVLPADQKPGGRN